MLELRNERKVMNEIIYGNLKNALQCGNSRLLKLRKFVLVTQRYITHSPFTKCFVQDFLIKFVGSSFEKI